MSESILDVFVQIKKFCGGHGGGSHPHLCRNQDKAAVWGSQDICEAKGVPDVQHGAYFGVWRKPNACLLDLQPDVPHA